MNNEFEHIDLDQFLKEKLGNYTETPTPAHLERFESSFSAKQISSRRSTHNRTIYYSAAAIVAAVAILLLIIKITPEPATTRKEAAQTEKQTVARQPSNRIPPESGPAATQAQPDFQPKVAIAAALPPRGEKQNNKQQTELAVNLSPKSDTVLPDTRGDVRFFTPSSPLNPIGFSSGESHTESSLKISKHPASNHNSPQPTRAPKAHKPKTIRKKSFNRSLFANAHINAKPNAKRNPISFDKPTALGLFLGKLEYKLNVTPLYDSQTLNNSGGVAALDFDPHFYQAIEKGRFSWSGGLEIAYPVDARWSVYSGLKWSAFKRITTNDYSHLTTINGLLAAPTSSGNVVIHGLTKDQLSSSAHFQTSLALQSAEIPLIARFHAGKNFYLDGGVKYSVIFSGKTRTKLTDSNQPFTYDQISDFKDQHLSVVLGSGFTFLTGSGIQVEAGPEICWNLTNLNPSSNLLNKPLTFGLRTSISLQRFERN